MKGKKNNVYTKVLYLVIKGETYMLETFNVLRIDEPDFGCEGRPDGMEVKDTVLLKSNYTGEEMTVREKDARLYELDINEGDKVFLIDGEMRKLR